MTGILIFVAALVLLGVLMMAMMSQRRKWVRIATSPDAYISASDHYSHLRQRGIRCKLVPQQEEQAASNRAVPNGTAASHAFGTVEPSFDATAPPEEVLKVHRRDIDKAYGIIEEYQASETRSFRL